MNATCSVSAKKLSGMRSSTRRPTGMGSRISSGMILVGSRTSKSKLSAKFWSKSCSRSSHSGKLPDWIAFHRSRRWKSGSAPLILTASFQTTDWSPSFRFPMEFDEGGFVLGVEHAERVDAKALHEAE